LRLYLAHPRHLNVELSIDIVEMGHHLVKDVALLSGAAQSYGAASSGLPE